MVCRQAISATCEVSSWPRTSGRLSGSDRKALFRFRRLGPEVWQRGEWNDVSGGLTSGTRRATIGCDSCRMNTSIQYLSAIAAPTFSFISGISSHLHLVKFLVCHLQLHEGAGGVPLNASVR